MPSGTVTVPSSATTSDSSDQAESSASAPVGVGRTATLGVLSTAFSSVATGFVQTRSAVGLPSSIRMPCSATCAGTPGPVASSTASASKRRPSGVTAPTARPSSTTTST